MSTRPGLANVAAELADPAVEHLERLLASWSLLADLSFADLLLYAPLSDSEPQRFVVVGQIRPTTTQTLHPEDQVGRVVDDKEKPVVARACHIGEIVDDEEEIPRGERIRIQCIPVRGPRGAHTDVLGILTRESAPMVRRKPGQLERVYQEIFDRFARMIATGEFPYPGETPEPEEGPRVGDGVLLLDAGSRVEYASPNAITTLHRMSVHSNLEGSRLGEVGFDDTGIRGAFSAGMPVTDEIERGPVVVLLRALPLLDQRRVTGAVVLIRDVSDLRRRDRLLLSKDAALREVHHRVKNNLQTISSLLHLQARRADSREARVAIDESVRRIQSIALVHEILSKAPGEEMQFDEIVASLVRMVQEDLLSPDRRVEVVVSGDPGELPTEVATPLAVVLNELLQNAVEHAFPAKLGADDGGRVAINFENDGQELCVRVRDNGAGLPPGFSFDQTQSVGLTIVRGLVTSQLEGKISMSSESMADGGGTTVELRMPARPPRPVER